MLIDNVTGKDVEQSVDEILSISPEIQKKAAISSARKKSELSYAVCQKPWGRIL
jgi:hypothetical protein